MIVKVFHEGVYHEIMIQRTSTAQDILEKFKATISKDFGLKNVFIIHNNEKINLVDFMAIKDLAEFLYDGKEFHIIESFKEGIIDVVVKYDFDIRTFEFNKKDVLGSVISKCEDVFNLDFDNYRLKFESIFYDRLDHKTTLDNITSEFTMLLEIVKAEKHPFTVDLYLILDKIYNATKQKTLVKYESDHIPSLKEIVDFLIDKYGFEESTMSFFKVNAFDEPIKRMKISACTLKNFEVEERIKIMVNKTLNELEFELKKFVIYVLRAYPEDLHKTVEIKIPLDANLSEFKTKIIAALKKTDPAYGRSIDTFTFQVLNAFNLPGKYIIKNDSTVRKYNFASNKILVRPVDNQHTPKQTDICVFLRKRISEERKYEGYQEVLIPEKFKNINPKNFDAFKLFIISALNLIGEEVSNLKLAIVDYKNFSWKIMDGRETHLKDGDEIGYLLKTEEHGKDDFQTDELTAIKFSENRQNYVFNYKLVKEKPFTINLEG